MSSPMSFRGHVKDGIVVLDQPLALPDGTPVLVEAVGPAAADFWRSPSLDELVAEQGVSAPASFEALAGGWPPDELHDDFHEVLATWREREAEPRK